MSIIEIDGFKCLDLTSLKSVPEELLEIPVWEIREFKFQSNVSYYKLKGKSNGSYKIPFTHCSRCAKYYCQLNISKNGELAILNFKQKTIE